MVPVTAVMVMARAAEAVMAVPMATVTHVAAVVTAVAAVLRLLDHVTGRRGRLGLDRERGQPAQRGAPKRGSSR
ncbi:protein of unknown function [Methylorubrum extorquens]|uniref:Uncharacterized protein n=1 Tax=Methylorubrum extorquens TaxID=408 RepID=A0A2N9AZ70_METEX|nr:protein of unknown function [Methylorubrum extorquens]